MRKCIWITLLHLVAIRGREYKASQFRLPEGSTADGVTVKSTYQCEGSDISLSCPHLSSIHVVRANYGRFSIAICNQQGKTNWSVQCSSQHSFNIISNLCNSLSLCVVPVNSSTFPDPCPLTSKYLEVHYTCQSGQTGAPRRQASLNAMDNDLSQLWSSNHQKISVQRVLNAMEHTHDNAREISDDNIDNVRNVDRIPITTTNDKIVTTTIRTTILTTTTTTTTSTTTHSTTITTTEVFWPQSTSFQLNLLSPNPRQVLKQSKKKLSLHSLKNKVTPHSSSQSSLGENVVPKNPYLILEIVTYTVAGVCICIITLLILRFRSFIQKKCIEKIGIQEETESSESTDSTSSGSYSPYQTIAQYQLQHHHYSSHSPHQATDQYQQQHLSSHSHVPFPAHYAQRRTQNYVKCQQSFLQNDQRTPNHRADSQCASNSTIASPSSNQLGLYSSPQDTSQRRCLPGDTSQSRCHPGDASRKRCLPGDTFQRRCIPGNTSLRRCLPGDMRGDTIVRESSWNSLGSSTNVAVQDHPQWPHLHQVTNTSILDTNLTYPGSPVDNDIPIPDHQHRRQHNYASPLMESTEVPWTVV